MKITAIREVTQPIKSDIRNAYIDFSKMTLSLVAVVTDMVKGGSPTALLPPTLSSRLASGVAANQEFSASGCIVNLKPSACMTLNSVSLLGARSPERLL